VTATDPWPPPQYHAEVTSTNDLALQLALRGAPEGSAVQAGRQTAGRGRFGREWFSPADAGLYLSVVARPDRAPRSWSLLTLAAGVAAAEAIERTTGLRCDLKWPNDLLIDGKKFCGILTEMNAEATRVRHIVIGIGINVNHASFPTELQTIATSLRLASGKELSRVELCAALLKSLDREYRALLEKSDARESVLKRFQERSSSVRDRQVYVEAENGGYEGMTYGLDPRGFLQVRTLQGLRIVLSSSVHLR